MAGLPLGDTTQIAPAVMINDEVYGKMTPEKMSELIKKLREE
mgnify:CR=1 FL=1